MLRRFFALKIYPTYCTYRRSGTYTGVLTIFDCFGGSSIPVSDSVLHFYQGIWVNHNLFD